MLKAVTLPCALAIGGLDPGGGAGILADLRGFHAAGAFGCAVVSVMTVQSTAGLEAADAVPAKRIVSQARAVLRNERVRAIKIGALGSIQNVRAVADLLAANKELPAIVDPVMLPSRGRARLLPQQAIAALRESLVPRATLITANIPEAEMILKTRVTSVSDAHDAALALVRLGARAALVKGGHLGGADATDVLAVGNDVLELRAKRLRMRPVHGGGCTLASLIGGRIAVAEDVSDEGIIAAVKWAKRMHHATLQRSRDVGGDLRVLVP
jgi:hydroxymethylpyrimidine/phosphomethylpyrimidine kinase